MTDNEIIKALECCDGFQCDECPLYEYSDDPVICERKCKQGSLDLINRQKAEIERYLHSIKLLEKDVAEAKTEAVKGFAEIVKANLDDFYYTREDGLLETGQLIDTLVNIWLQETKKEGTEK